MVAGPNAIVSPDAIAIAGVAAIRNSMTSKLTIFIYVGRESAIGCYLYNLFIHATWGVAKWAKEVQSLDS